MAYQIPFQLCKASEKGFTELLSFALVQWFSSLQHRVKRYLGRGGNMMHGLLPAAFIIGTVFSTIF
jgi:hypothetical protein